MADDGGEAVDRRPVPRSDGPEDLGPYLDLAREIRSEVEKLAADDTADASLIEDAIDRFPAEARAQVARSAFERLAPERQWEVIERIFGDDEIHHYLEAERAARRTHARDTAALHGLALRSRAEGALDTRLLPGGALLTLGLFREPEVAAAVRRGRDSSACVRRVALRAEGDGSGSLRVVEDVFDPSRAYFVTRDYDEQTWRSERLESHDRVWVGSLGGTDSTGADGVASFAPVLVAGARVDVLRDAATARGRLHLGFAMLAEDDVFAG